MSGDERQRDERSREEPRGRDAGAPQVRADSPGRDATVDGGELERLAGGAHHDPHSILGAHPTADGRTVVRTLRPEASAVTALVGGARVPLSRLRHGVFGGTVDGAPTD
jgi:1,4-alpha-glucan branching enzyme